MTRDPEPVAFAVMNESFFSLDDLEPSLRQAFGEKLPDPALLLKPAVAIPAGPDESPPVEARTPLPLPNEGPDRSEIVLVSGDDTWGWKVSSLRSLFRGTNKAPEFGAYPEGYNESFLVLDFQAMQISDIFGPRRDREMLEIYSALRRRPDGRSLGFVHDCMWQAAALMLGLRPLSEAEYEAILARLERSCRSFERGPTSANYVAALRQTFASL